MGKEQEWLLTYFQYFDMKIYLFILFGFLSSSLFSQNSSQHSLNVEYKILNNTESPNTMYSKVYVNGGETIYIADYDTQVFNDAKYEAKRNRLFGFKEYLKIDHKQKEIFYFDYLGQNPVLIKDDYNSLKWDITAESKVIAGYNCTKATSAYRGRNWIAWFSTDIALPYGPWKLHGLPGLIIEAYDATNTYLWRAEKIEFKKDAIFDKDFSTFLITKNKKPISLKKYIEDEAEREANVDAEFLRNNPDVIVGSKEVVRSGYELKYEWEK